MTDQTSTPQQVLDTPMSPNDSGADTIRGYLAALLAVLWRERDSFGGFGGKRPFGNSGWAWDLYQPLVQAGLIMGTIDEDGLLDDCDTRTGDRLIASAIEALGVSR